MNNAAKGCPFCQVEKAIDGNLVYARPDRFPVSKGHFLIVTKRHAETWFEMTNDEKLEAIDLIDKVKLFLDNEFEPDGYNIGMNCGTPAGQTIPHAHIHVIPRYKEDMADPRGGVRGVIPEKQSY